MKVLMINGSPHKNGCTNRALEYIAEELKLYDVESEILWIGGEALKGCMGCGACAKLRRCVIDDDIVNVISSKAKEFDGFIFGSPVHYASISGPMATLMSRLFYSSSPNFKYKPAASIVSARRAGTTAAYDVMNKYIGISNMIQVPAPYWNMVHGWSAEDVEKDEEGVYIMRSIAHNMAWLLQVLNGVKGTELEKPNTIKRARTNFIR